MDEHPVQHAVEDSRVKRDGEVVAPCRNDRQRRRAGGASGQEGVRRSREWIGHRGPERERDVLVVVPELRRRDHHVDALGSRAGSERDGKLRGGELPQVVHQRLEDLAAALLLEVVLRAFLKQRQDLGQQPAHVALEGAAVEGILALVDDQLHRGEQERFEGSLDGDPGEVGADGEHLHGETGRIGVDQDRDLHPRRVGSAMDEICLAAVEAQGAEEVRTLVEDGPQPGQVEAELAGVSAEQRDHAPLEAVRLWPPGIELDRQMIELQLVSITQHRKPELGRLAERQAFEVGAEIAQALDGSRLALGRGTPRRAGARQGLERELRLLNAPAGEIDPVREQHALEMILEPGLSLLRDVEPGALGNLRGAAPCPRQDHQKGAHRQQPTLHALPPALSEAPCEGQPKRIGTQDGIDSQCWSLAHAKVVNEQSRSDPDCGADDDVRRVMAIAHHAQQARAQRRSGTVELDPRATRAEDAASTRAWRRMPRSRYVR